MKVNKDKLQIPPLYFIKEMNIPLLGHPFYPNKVCKPQGKKDDDSTKN